MPVSPERGNIKTGTTSNINTLATMRTATSLLIALQWRQQDSFPKPSQRTHEH